MKNFIRILLLASAVVLLQVDTSAQTCDPYFVLRGGTQPEVMGGTNQILLPTGNVVGPSSIKLTTVPNYLDAGFSFITHAEQLHLIHYDSTGPELTFDLKAEAGLTGFLVLQDSSAASPVVVDTEKAQFALYVVGYLSDAGGVVPYYFVLDQEAIMERWEDPLSTAPVLLHSGTLCETGQPCGGLAGDVQVFSQAGEAKHQVAYAQLLTFASPPVHQQIVKISRTNSPTSGWQTTIAEDVGPAVNDFPNMGFAFDTETEIPYAVVGGQVIDLDSGVANCKFGSIVTDISIWSVRPSHYPAFTKKSYTFAAIQNTGSSKLVGYPTGECPDITKTSTLSIAVPHKAIKTSIVQTWKNKLMVRVLSTDGSVKNFEIEVQPGGGTTEDTLAILSQTTDAAGSDPVDFIPKPTNLCGCGNIVYLGDPPFAYCNDRCIHTENGDAICQGSTDPIPPRCIDPADPLCTTPIGLSR